MRVRGLLMAGGVVAVLPAAGLVAQPGTASAQESSWNEWVSGEYATGNWGGTRDKLIEMGITIEAEYIADFQTLAAGGEDDGNGWSYAGLLLGGIDFDLEKLFGWSGGRFFAQAAWSTGQDLSERHIGALFPVAAQFTGNAGRLAELYLEQNLLGDTLSIAGGRLTTDADFGSSPIYGEYVSAAINSSPFNIPDGQPGYTTPPFAQWGIRAIWTPIEEIRTGIGIYNADQRVNENKKHGLDWSVDLDDGVMTIGEFGYLWNQKEGATGLPGTGKIGFVYSNGDLDKVRDNGEEEELIDAEFQPESGGTPTQGNNYGFYVSVEQMIYREGDAGSTEGLTGWGVVSYSPRDNINTNPLFVGGGLVYQGLIPGRGDDRTAVGVFYGKLSSAIQNVSSEKVVEVNHTFQVTPWFFVRPDFQYIFNPGGRTDIDDALVLGGEVGIFF
jgi:porin